MTIPLSAKVTVAVALVVAATAGAAGNQGRLGGTVKVQGQTKELLLVTAVRLQDPASGYQTAAGMRVVGVVFRVRNVGTVQYKDFPTAALTLASGKRTGSAITTGGSCDSPSTVTIHPGQSTTFCLPFQVPARATLRTVAYEPDSGYGTPATFTLG